MEYVLLAFFGLAFGSFINALVWRLHENRDFVRERSECVHCHHTLGWYDLIPVVSWLLLRGKCRYCKRPISWQYPAVEIITATLFVISYMFWPLALDAWTGMALLILWLIMLVLLIALAVYDIKWYLLPEKLTIPLTVLAAVYAVIYTLLELNLNILEALVYVVLGVASVAGLYYVLHAVSKGRWVGFGDVVLGVSMGLILGWELGLLAVFIANLVGLMVALPVVVLGKMSTKSRIPFGPFLIIGLIISLLFGQGLIEAYIGFIFSV